MKAPLEMPADVYLQHEFEQQRIDYMAPEGGGRVNGVQAGFPLWQASYSLESILSVDESDAVRAFVSQLRGATRRFLARDISRPYPKAHCGGFDGMTKAGGGSFSGTVDDWSENITADDDSEVTLENLPAGFVLSVGDYIGFRWTATETSVAGLTWHACVRVVVGGTADGSGDVTVTCEPPVPSAVPDSATAYLDEPACVMALLVDRSSLQPQGQALTVEGGTIVGIQDIRA
jgi:hypothetical protein